MVDEAKTRGFPARFFVFALVLVVSGRALLLLRYLETQPLDGGHPEAGIAYDVFAIALLCLMRLALGAVPLVLLRRALIAALGVAAVVLVVGNQLHLNFFRSTLEPWELARSGDVPLVWKNLVHLTGAGELLVLGVALVLLASSLGGEALRRPRIEARSGVVIAAILVVGLIGNWLGNYRRGFPKPLPLRASVLVRWTQFLAGFHRKQTSDDRRFAYRPEWLAPGSLAQDFPLEQDTHSLDVEGFPLARHRGLAGRAERLRAAGVDVEALAKLGDRPNVIVVMLESVRASELGAFGNPDGLTPNLDRIAAEGLMAERGYASSTASIQGSFATQCSYPPEPFGVEYLRDNPRLSTRCLHDVLSARGYGTRWFSAFARYFDGEGLFALAHGVSRVVDVDDYPKEAERLGWGVSDEALFERVVRDVSAMPEPFAATVTTLSNHHPFGYVDEYQGIKPSSYGMTEYGAFQRGVSYADYAVGKFLERARLQPWFAHTVFFFVADHGIWIFPSADDWPRRGGKPAGEQFKELYYRIPILLYAPGLVRPGRITIPVSQLDVLPTILDLTASEADGVFLGTSLFALDPDRRLLLSGGGGLHAIQGDVRCWEVESSEHCVKQKAFPLYDPDPLPSVDRPDLKAWAVRAAAITQALGKGDRLLPPAKMLNAAAK